MKVIIAADDAQIAPQFRIEKIRVRSADEIPPVVTPDRMLIPAPVGDLEADEEPDVVDADDEDDDSDEDTEEQRAADAATARAAARRPNGGERRRRRRRGGRRDDQPGGIAAGDASGEAAESGTPGPAANDDASDALVAAEALAPADGEPEEGAEGGEAAAAAEDDPRNRRRGRRGGRRRRRDGDGELSPFSVPGADQPDLPPVYVGPTPADPFGGRAFDIFDVMDQVERAAEAKPVPRAAVSQRDRQRYRAGGGGKLRRGTGAPNRGGGRGRNHRRTGHRQRRRAGADSGFSASCGDPCGGSSSRRGATGWRTGQRLTQDCR